MKLLYFSCHAILEYDELKLFEELGIDYFSLGSYVVPTNPVDPIRPALKHAPEEWLTNNAPDREAVPGSFVEKFDIIVIMHRPEWIVKNWPNIGHKRVIWRTIGQSTPKIEALLSKYRKKGMQVIRYSPREIMIEGNVGCDQVIRFYKDPKEFGHWVGAGNEVITIAQNMATRGEHCNYEAFRVLSQGFNAHVYGPKNEDSGELNGGFLTYDQMRQKLRDARAYIYTGTQPASYTLNFIEAFMTGVPIVALGPKHGNRLKIAGPMYEIGDIIKDGYNGYISDDLNYLREKIKDLTESVKLARRIGEMGRQTALEMFGKEFIKEQWRRFLYEHHK